MEQSPNIDAIAAKYGGVPTQDADAIAAKYGGTVQSSAPAAEPRWNEPGGDVLLDNVRAIGRFGKHIAQGIVAHPVESLATAGGIAAVPLTGATSLIPAAAAAGLGGAGGAGVGLIAKAARGDADTPTTAGGVVGEMGKQGLIQAAAEGGGRMIQGTLRMIAKPLYRAAVRPAARLTDKYGDLVTAGLEEAAPVGASKNVQARMLASKGATDQLVSDAEAAGRSVPTPAVTSKYTPLVDTAANREALGVPGDLDEIAARERAFTQQHPTAQIAPTRALVLKREADTLAGTAQNQLRRGNTPTDMTARLHDATRSGLNEGLEAATQGLTSPDGLSYADQNARTSTMYGLSRALRTAENRPHALTNLLSLGAGVLGGAGGTFATGDYRKGSASGLGEALLLRALAASTVQSRAGIGLYQLAGVPFAQLVRAAVLSRLAARSTAPAEQTRATQEKR